MKTASPTSSLLLIDTTPLAVRFEIMMASLMGFIAAGRYRDVLRYSYKVGRLVRVFTKLEAHNARLSRKLEMLAHRPWRELVVKELGGLKRLKRWEASFARIKARGGRRLNTPEPQPAWLLTPERIAESERLKAHARKCGRATAHPRVFRDKYRMDFAGEFRLAPLPRAPRGQRQIKVYTQHSITEYDWNNIPFAKETGFGPAMIWPAEVFAAMEIEMGISQAHTSPPCIPDQRFEKNVRSGIQFPRSDNWVPNQVWDERDLKDFPRLSLKDVLSRKVHDDLCGSLTR